MNTETAEQEQAEAAIDARIDPAYITEQRVRRAIESLNKAAGLLRCTLPEHKMCYEPGTTEGWGDDSIQYIIHTFPFTDKERTNWQAELTDECGTIIQGPGGWIAGWGDSPEIAIINLFVRMLETRAKNGVPPGPGKPAV